MDDELRHYGILGQKWGIRRTPEQLGRRRDELKDTNRTLGAKLDKINTSANKNYHKSVKIGMKNERQQRRISKAQQKIYKYERKVEKANNKKYVPDYEKMRKYEMKISKQKNKIHKAEVRLKHNPYQIKYEACVDLANKTKRRIEKNDKMIHMLDSTINAINNGTIEQGKYFMKYVE